MAITNNQIIMLETMQLITDGKISPNEEIHTFARWQAMGYSVKKGEHAITKFAIWKYGKGKTDEENEMENAENGYCFMKMSCWFSSSQVEKTPENEGVHNVKAARPNYKKHAMRTHETADHAIFCNF